MDAMKEFSDPPWKLSEKSDNLDEVISSVNEWLRKLNFELEVWLDDPVYTGRWKVRDPETHARIAPEQDAILLGYCQVSGSGAWELAIKNAVLFKKMYWGCWSGLYARVKNSGSPKSLLAASEDIKVKAIEHIPALLHGLKYQAQELLKSIKKAEAVAKKL